jgi:Oligonucleotide/oligosaccharide-binding (OB)-fold
MTCSFSCGHCAWQLQASSSRSEKKAGVPETLLCLQVESSAVQVKFFERRKGRVFHHPASINFDCGRFESGWLVYTDMVETSKVHAAACVVPKLAARCTLATRRANLCSCMLHAFHVGVACSTPFL